MISFGKKESKIKTIKALIVVLVVVAVANGLIYYRNWRTGSPSQKKMNVILISVDSLRSDHISANGYYRQTTPNIDTLAKGGIIFNNCITQSYITPVSEMSLQSGTYPSTNSLISLDTVSSKNILTIAQILKIYGYRTAAFGNSPEFHLFPATAESFNRGYDEYDISDFRNNLPNINSIVNFASAKSDKPFFLWLPLGSVHYWYGKYPEHFSDPNYSGPFKGQMLDWFNGVLTWIYKNNFYETDAGKVTQKIALSQADIQYIIDKYDGDVLATDSWIGQLMDALKKNNLDKNTIIIFESEHGDDLNDHGYFNHYDIYDTEVKTFMVIKNPSIAKKDVVINDQVQSINVLPTVLDYLDIPIPHQAEGESLKPLIENNEKISENQDVFIERTPLWERIALAGPKIRPDAVPVNQYLNQAKSKILPFYSQKTIDYILSPDFLNNVDVAVRTNDWKLIYRASKDFQEKYSWWNVLSGEHPPIAQFELYDLKADPYETKNVIDQHPDVAAELEPKLLDFYKKTQISNTPEIKEPIYDYF